jgi:hypothetical protein
VGWWKKLFIRISGFTLIKQKVTEILFYKFMDIVAGTLASHAENETAGQ